MATAAPSGGQAARTAAISSFSDIALTSKVMSAPNLCATSRRSLTVSSPMTRRAPRALASAQPYRPSRPSPWTTTGNGVWEFQNTRPRQNVTVFGEAAEKMRIILGQIVTVLAQTRRLLRHVVDIAVVGRPMMEELGPSYPIPDSQRITAHVLGNVAAQLIDDADDRCPR